MHPLSRLMISLYFLQLTSTKGCQHHSPLQVANQKILWTQWTVSPFRVVYINKDQV